MPGQTSERETSKTVDRALFLLRAVGEHGPTSSADLARRTGLNRTVVHRLLATLEQHGFVRRSADGYGIGMAVMELGDRVELTVRERARPVLERLAGEFGETAVLSVADGGEVVALDQVFGGRHMVQVRYQPGFRHPLTLGAHGRAILAFADQAATQAALAAVPDPAALRESLALTRERGWAFSHDELQLGASGLAVPLFDDQGRAIASVGIVAPVARFPDLADLAAATLAAAAAAQMPAMPGERYAG